VNVSEPSPLNALLGGSEGILGASPRISFEKNNPRITKPKRNSNESQKRHTTEGTISDAEVASLRSPPWLNFFFVLLTQHKKKKKHNPHKPLYRRTNFVCDHRVANKPHHRTHITHATNPPTPK